MRAAARIWPPGETSEIAKCASSTNGARSEAGSLLRRTAGDGLTGGQIVYAAVPQHLLEPKPGAARSQRL